MQYGIPIFNDRVAPRCTIADMILIIRVSRDEILSVKSVEIEEHNSIALLKLLMDNKVEILVCGGISRENKNQFIKNSIEVIDNVACNRNELLYAIKNNLLIPGFGFTIAPDEIKVTVKPQKKTHNKRLGINCITCISRECESGKPCPILGEVDFGIPDDSKNRMLESALDISLEEERKLCRLSELIYYALEMKYTKIGIAYCSELREPTEILVTVLRRFFEIYPVCCKVGGRKLNENFTGTNIKVACNPLGQAMILNKIGTEFNIIVGLCVGADCLFSQESKAPVTTLFVKDKSLANNPIGALYSDYYLKEVSIE